MPESKKECIREVEPCHPVSIGCSGFVLGLGSTAVIYQIIVNSVHEREQVYFDFRAREAVERIKSRMAAYQQVLRGTAGIFNIYKIVDRHQFRDYYERQALERYLPGIQGDD
ncbi:hypothetical protein ACU79H_004275 [Vibrio fluvialis]